MITVGVTGITKSHDNWMEVVTYMYDDESTKKSDAQRWKFKFIQNVTLKYSTVYWKKKLMFT